MQVLDNNQPIVDLFFIHCLKKLNEQLKSKTIMLTLRAAVLAVVLPLHLYYFDQTNQETKSTLTLYFQIILFQNIIEVLRNLYFYTYKFKNRRSIIKIADDFKHSFYIDDLKDEQSDQLQQQLLIYEIEPQWNLKVSSLFYDFENMEKVTEVTDEFKVMRENIGHSSIKTSLKSQICCYKALGYLMDTAAAFLLIYCAIIYFKVPITDAQQTLLLIYIATQIEHKPKLFAILIVIAIIPLVIGFALIYICICKKQKKADLPKAIEMNAHMLSRCSECAICFQSFQVGQKVMELKCSNVHIFHSTCIEGWTKIKANCPICRHDLS